MTKRQWRHSIEVRLILSVTVFKECSADSILDAETLISIVSEVQIQLTKLLPVPSLSPYLCKITVYVVFNESTLTFFPVIFKISHYLGLLLWILRMQATEKRKGALLEGQ